MLSKFDRRLTIRSSLLNTLLRCFPMPTCVGTLRAMPLLPEAQAARVPAEHLVESLDQALAAAPITTVRRSEAPDQLLGRPTIGRLLRFVLEEWVMMAALWGVMFIGPHWLYPVLALLVAGRLHALGVLLHDAAHMPLRSKGLAVRLLEILAGYPIATTIDAMRYHHLRHHRDNGMRTDPYFKAGAEESKVTRFLLRIRGVILIPFWTVRTLVGLVALMVPGVRHGYGRIFLQDRSGDDLRQSKEVERCAREDIGQLLFQLGVVALWIRFPHEVLYGYVIPISITGVLSSNRVVAEHIYHSVTDRRTETQFTITMDHGLGLIGKLFMAPRNIGFHIVHHLHPQVALENLPALRRWYTQRYPDLYPPPGRHSVASSVGTVS